MAGVALLSRLCPATLQLGPEGLVASHPVTGERMSTGRRSVLAIACAGILGAVVFAVHATEQPADSLQGRRATCVDFRSAEGFTIGAQHLLGDGTIASQWDPASTPLCVGAALEVASVSIPDGSGGAIVVWVDTRSGESDLYAQRVTAAGAVASGWPLDGIPVCLARGFQDRLALTSDGFGGVIAVWQDYRGGSQGSIYAQRVTASGDVVWGTDGVVVSADSSDQAAPDVVADGAGGAFVVWQDDRGGDYDLRWARLDSQGAISPAAGGAPLVESPGDQRAVRLVAGLAGVVIAVWQDAQGDLTRLRSAHFSMDVPGALSGADIGALVAADVGIAAATAIASNGVGGAFVAWSSRLSGPGDIRLQHIDAQGGVAHGDTGLVVCSEPHEQYAPALCPDGAGGCVVAWEDFRGGTADLYAQRVTADGMLAWPGDGVALCTEAGEQYGVALRADGGGGAYATWSDNVLPARATFLRARPTLSGELPRLVSIEVGPGRAHLVWRGAVGDATPYLVQRRSGEEGWRSIRESSLGPEGALEHEDRGVAPGSHVVYRLAVQRGEALVSLEEADVDIPLPMPLALRFVHTEDRGRQVRVSYVLETHDRATLEVLDIAGRRVLVRDLGAPGAGEHEFRFSSDPLAAGIYFVRLHQGQRLRTARLVLIR